MFILINKTTIIIRALQLLYFENPDRMWLLRSFRQLDSPPL